jgi:hypothetical protein
MITYRFDVATKHYGSWAFVKNFASEVDAENRAQEIQVALNDAVELIDFREIGRCKDAPCSQTDDDGIYRPFATESN